MRNGRCGMTTNKIAVLGLGFVGLTTAVGFRNKGFDVIGFDINKKRNQLIRDGIIPFHEPRLATNMRLTPIKVAHSMDEATLDADIIFLCVGTPQGEDGKVDLTFIKEALEHIKAKEDVLVVVKSTVVPGTTKSLVSKYRLANNPEFLREGFAWEDFINPDRIVCGVTDEKSREQLEAVYKPFNSPVHFTTLNTAEFIKYISNVMLANVISFSNEMATIADTIGEINTGKAFKILHEDARLMGSGITNYIYPGAGYGGYCLPKDTVALSALAKEKGVETHILDSVIEINNKMPLISVEKIKKVCSSKDMGITILGLSFKPDSDDVRDTISAKIIEILLEEGYTNINAYDPLAIEEFQKYYNFDIDYNQDLKEVVVIATGWEVFRHLDFKEKTVVDLRYLLEE